MTERIDERRIVAALQTLNTTRVFAGRLILSDRRGRYKPALIEYTPEEFAEKLADAIAVADEQDAAERAAYEVNNQ